MDASLERRDFLKGAAAGIVMGAAAAGLGSARAEAEEASGAAEGEETAAFAARPEAGGGVPKDWGAFRSGADPIPPAEPPARWDAEADIVVVGTGLGGTSAALYAAEAGASVIAVEKSAKIGGASRHASNIHINTGGTKLQNETGYAWPNATFDPDNPQDVQEAVAAFLEGYEFSPDYKLLAHSIEEGPRFGDWLDEQDGFELVAPNYYTFAPLRDKYVVDNGLNEVLGFNHMFNALEEDLVAKGVDLRLGTQCTRLVAQDGAVLGIVAESGGAEQYLRARKGVILAGGGMGYNMDLLEKYIPTAYRCAACGGPVPEHTGECIRMGLGMNADMAGFDSVSFWNGVLDEYWQGSSKIWYSYMYRPMSFFSYLPFLRIDRRCNRIPFYQGGGGDPQPLFKVSSVFTAVNMVANIEAQCGTVDHRMYMVFDSDFRTHYDKEWKGTTFEHLNPETLFYGPGLTEEGAAYLPESFDKDWQDALDMGAVRQADTLEELAGLWGFDPEAFVATVEEWNAMCEAGEDTGVPVPMLPEWMVPVKNPPFYCGAWGVDIGKTQCGLRTDEDMRVLDKDYKVIPGLYAVWSTAGGLTGEHDHSDFGSCTPFGSVGASGVTGFMAARSALGEYEE